MFYTFRKLRHTGADKGKGISLVTQNDGIKVWRNARYKTTVFFFWFCYAKSFCSAIGSCDRLSANF